MLSWNLGISLWMIYDFTITTLQCQGHLHVQKSYADTLSIVRMRVFRPVPEVQFLVLGSVDLSDVGGATIALHQPSR